MPDHNPETSDRELSGITPSGPLTLGNYLGALRRFTDRQDHGFYFVANLHALTTTHEPARLRELTRSTAALFLACGLDPDRATVFLQSDVTEHVRLAYLLECTAHVGELGRMIQFKEKGGRPATRASLFTYPCLMAADILLYDPLGGSGYLSVMAACRGGLTLAWIRRFLKACELQQNRFFWPSLPSIRKGQ